MPVPDITSLYQTPEIQQAGQQASQAAQTAVNYQSAASQLPTQLKKAIEDKLNYNKDIIDAQSKAEANYFAAPAQARQQYQDIFNPFDREALVAQSVANAYAPYQSLTSILGQREGNINDIVNAGVGAFNSQVGAEQGAAQIAQNRYQDLLSGADRLASAKEWQWQAANPGGGSASSIAEAKATAAMQKDINSGMTYSDLLQRYAQDLPEYTIRQAYNAGPLAKRYGPAKETPAQENALLQGLPGLTGTKSASSATKWQVKNVSANVHQGGLQTPFGTIGGKDVKQTQQYLFDPNTGRSIHADSNGNIHVRDKKSGETGYLPIGEFDASKYDPI